MPETALYTRAGPAFMWTHQPARRDGASLDGTAPRASHAWNGTGGRSTALARSLACPLGRGPCLCTGSMVPPDSNGARRQDLLSPEAGELRAGTDRPPSEPSRELGAVISLGNRPGG